MKALFLSLVLALSALGAHAVEPQERLSDPVLEARARVISGELRCLVCQNESIDESDAGLAHDIRMLLRQRIAAGDTDAQAIQYIVNRYGQFVLLKPPVEPATYALWFGPPLLLALAGLALVVRARRRAEAPPPPPLSAAEKAQLEALLEDDEP